MSNGKAAVMTAVLLLTITVPLAAMTWLRKRRGGKWFPFFVGALIFPVFAMGLEQVLHLLVLNSPLGPAVRGNIWLYGLYGGLAAGLFEETGRLVAFKYFLKEHTRPVTAVSYGLGHGGMEAVLLVGLTMLSNLLLAQSYVQGAELPPEAVAAVQAVLDTPAVMFFWSGLERVSAIILHVALSVLVFAAVRTEKRWLFPAAVLAHGAVDCIAVVSNAYLPVAATEVLVLLAALLTAVWAAGVYKKLPENAEIP